MPLLTPTNRFMAPLLTLLLVSAATWAPAQAVSSLEDPRYRAVIDELLSTPQGRAFLETYVALRRDQLPEVGSEALLHGALQGLIAAVDDPYVRWLSPSAVEAEAARIRLDAAVATLSFEEVGYLRIASFNSENVGPAVQSAVMQLLDDGAEALILDLRTNPGGLIRAGLPVLDLFISDAVLGFRSKRSDAAPIAFANPGALEVPLAVLIDGDTASTAELVAGALQTLGRALLYGEASAGKGVGQTRLVLSDGGVLELVSFRWLLPDGRSVSEGGLTPDVALDPGAELGEGRPAFGELELDPVLRVALRDLLQVLRSGPSALPPHER
jgi:C-terminal processing protease CtpA/Prc